MENYIVLDGFSVLIILLTVIFFAVGFCLAVLCLQDERDKRQRLKERNKHLRERLSLTQYEMYMKCHTLPKENKNV